MKTHPRLVCLLIFIMCTPLPGRACACQIPGDEGLLLPVGPPPVIAAQDAADPPAPIVTVKLRVPACVDAEKNLEYRILVENCSPAQALRVVVLDHLPPNAKFVRATPPPTRTDPELQWQIGTLKPFSCQEIILVLAPTNAEDITNCVRVQFEHGVCATTRQAASQPKMKLAEDAPIPKEPPPKGPKTKEPPSTKEPPLADGAKLKVSVAKPPSPLPFNEKARFVITVTNEGSAPAREVSIESDLPDTLSFVDATHRGREMLGKVGWSLGIIEAGKNVSVELILQAKKPGTFCFKTRAEFDPKLNLFTPFESTCATFLGIPAMSMELFDREDPIPVHGTTSYPIRILNQGSAPVTNIRIQAVVPDGMEFVRATTPYTKEGQIIVFSLATLDPGVKKEYEVFTRAMKAGDLRFKIEMTADQLKEGGPVHEEESTTVYSEDGGGISRTASWLRAHWKVATEKQRPAKRTEE